MGQSSSFELHGWRANGDGLPVSVKEEIQDVMFSTDVDDYSSVCNDKDSFIMNCGSEYYGAYDSAFKALSAYAQEHDDAVIEMYYDCEEENDYRCVRFKGVETEEYDRVSVYPPFAKLVIPNENHPLPLLKFNFKSIKDSQEAAFLVLLNRWPSTDMIGTLEDSISSYMENMPTSSCEQLIHDVLSAEGIGHWILSPTHTFNI